MNEPWWRSAVFYQVYPRSFADGDQDGVGDLKGLLTKVDHLSDLGVDAIWLSPIFPSPMADFGYDVSDYCGVDPLFGDLDVFDEVLAAVHDRGLRLILDWVPNHTSIDHPWFKDALTGPDAEHRDWYVWRDSAPDGGPPNNWVAAFAPVPAWTRDPASGQWYLHHFLPQQPDLNWANPAVEAAMHDTLRFWLDRGVDGFRADVINCIGKDPALADAPENLAPLMHCVLNDEPGVHPLLRRIRSVLDEYPGDRMMIGEVALLDPHTVAAYYGDGDELHLSFNFMPLHGPWRADTWRANIATTEDGFRAADAWPTWVLSNHDVPRHRTRYSRWPHEPVDAEGSLQRTRAAATLLLTLRGTPFIYQGEELGLEDAVVPAARVVDPGGRDGCRAPVPWAALPPHGWPTPSGIEPWLPFPPDATDLNVEAELTSPDSVLALYRRLLAMRRGSRALQHGTYEPVDAPDGVLAFRRFDAESSDERMVAVNFTDDAASVEFDNRWDVELASDDTDTTGPFDGKLRPRQAVVLRRAAG